MSNIVLKGDIIQNLGEYFPNVYIESVQVEQLDTSNIQLNFFCSLLFMISDHYNADDIVKNLDGIKFNVFISNSQEKLTKQQVIDSITTFSISGFEHFVMLEDSDIITEKIASGDFQDDLYDEEGRRLLKINFDSTVTMETKLIQELNLHAYVFSSLFNTLDMRKMDPQMLYFNTSNIAHEKIFSAGLNVLREEEVIYIGTQGEKYGQVPILGLDRNFYKTQNVTREDIISKVNSLVRRFEGRNIGPLTDSVNSIKAVLSKESDTEKLLVELDKVRRSFPNKTNNNPVGNLYASFAKLLQNINSSFSPGDIVKKEKYLTGKVVDLRTGLTFGYDAPSPTEQLDYLPEDMFLIHRERISTDETDDLAINVGVFFIRYEEMLKRESNISQILNIEKLLETTSGSDLDDLRRILFSYFRIQSIYLEKYFKDSPAPIQVKSKIYTSVRDNRKTNPISATLPGSDGRYVSANVDPPLTQIFRELNFGFDDPKERLLCFEFRDIDSFTATFELDEIENEGSMRFRYVVRANMYDETQNFVTKLTDKFDEIYELLNTYVELAQETCSYNNIDNRFNDFFVQTIRDQYTPGKYPWELAPSIYSMMAYISTNQFETFEDVIRYSKNVSATISPESGNLASLVNFRDLMYDLKTEQLSDLKFAASRLASTTTQISLVKSAQLIPFNFVQLEREADLEFESLKTDGTTANYTTIAATTSGGSFTSGTGMVRTDNNYQFKLLTQIADTLDKLYTKEAAEEAALFVGAPLAPNGFSEASTRSFPIIISIYEYLRSSGQTRFGTREDLLSPMTVFVRKVEEFAREQRDASLRVNGLGYYFDFSTVITGATSADRSYANNTLIKPMVDSFRDGMRRVLSDFASEADLGESGDSPFFRSIDDLVGLILDYYRINSNFLMPDINTVSMALGFPPGYGGYGADYEYYSYIIQRLGIAGLPFGLNYSGPAKDEIANIEDAIF